MTVMAASGRAERTKAAIEGERRTYASTAQTVT